jgi:hypothetical protein
MTSHGRWRYDGGTYDGSMKEALTDLRPCVAVLLAAREQMRSIPALHRPFADLVLKAIERIAVPVPVTATNLSPDSKTESAGRAPRPSGTSAVVNTNTGANDRIDTGSEENEWALVTPEMGFESHHVADKASFKRLFSGDRKLVRARGLLYIDFRSHPFCIYSGQWVSSTKGEMG